MQRRRTTAATVALGLATLLVLSGPTGIALAAHGSMGNFTALPATDEDRQPGFDSASYKSWSEPPDNAEFKGFKYLEYSILKWEAGTLGGCGPGSSEVAGVDRGDDDPGTEVDDTAKDNIEGQPVSNEDRVVVDFNDPSDPIGETLHLNRTDEFVTYVTDCRGNPDEPGWYQLTGTINGTTWEGQHVERTTKSHYFWICDCDSYDEAVDRMGPPPSKEGQATPTPTATAEPTPTATAEPTPTRTPPPEGTPFPSPTPTATPTPTPEPTPTATATATATATEASSGASTPTATATPAAWAANTPARGPGFGVVAALVGLLAAALLGGRR